MNACHQSSQPILVIGHRMPNMIRDSLGTNWFALRCRPKSNYNLDWVIEISLLANETGFPFTYDGFLLGLGNFL